MSRIILRSQTQTPIELVASKRPAFPCTNSPARSLKQKIVSLGHRATLGPSQQSFHPSKLFRKISGRLDRQKRLYATTTAQQSRSQFTYSMDQLSAMAEDMLEGKKQSVSTQELLAGLATSEARGLSDSSEQASERRRRFGVNKLPSRKEVRSSSRMMKSAAEPQDVAKQQRNVSTFWLIPREWQ